MGRWVASVVARALSESEMPKGVVVFFGKSSLADLFDAIDRKDAQAFERFLHDQVRFRFGNGSSVLGRRAVADRVQQFFDSLQALRHVVARSWEHGDTVICSGEVTYTRVNGTELCVPFANILTIDSGLIVDYSIYADISDLYRER